MSHTPSLEKRATGEQGNRPSTTKTRAGKVDNRPSSILTLAFWRLRQTWGLLCMACVGFVAAMIIACVVPLFTTVATSSSLQSIFQSAPGINNVTLSINTQGLSTSIVSTLQQQIANGTQKLFSPYLRGNTPLNIQQSYLKVLSPAALQKTQPLSIYATDLSSLEPHLKLLAGRWPAENTPGVIEVLLTPQAAQGLKLTLGSEMTLQGEFATADATSGPIYPNTQITVRLVGLFQTQPAALPQLGGQNLQPTHSAVGTTYTLLASTTSFLNSLDTIAARARSDAVYSYLTFQLSWNYTLQTSGVQPDQVSDLITRLYTAQTDVSNYQSGQKQGPSGTTTFPYITQNNLYNPLPNSYELLNLLSQYSGRVALVSIPITILAVQIIALLLFFVSLLIGMLVDRQLATNALLSSRGASGGQIFWSLAYQGTGLCLLGLLLGPLAGTALVSLLAQHTLNSIGTLALRHIVNQPGLFFTSVAAPAGGTLLAALLTMGLIIRYTTRTNMLTLRRETARASRQPFWQRYYLDVLAALIALSGYGVSLYLASVAHEVDLGTQDLLLGPLTIVAPIFLLLGCLLLFLRLFPWLLRGGSWLASRGRGSTAMLALVQMARSPRQVTRMILLLSLTVAFALFALVLSASQAQRASDIAAYETATDFSGDLSAQSDAQPINTILARYRSIPGALSACAGYIDTGTSAGNSNANVALTFQAVDSQSFAQTVIWSSQSARQAFTALLAPLTTMPNTENAPPDVPVIVDQALANQMGLYIGDIFDINLSDLGNVSPTYQVVGIIAHIPTILPSLMANASAPSGGMLVDYQTFDQIYRRAEASQYNQYHPDQPKTWTDLPSVLITHLWLRTSDDARTLSSVRAVLNSSKLALSNLYDRRAIISDLQNDPFTVNMLLVLDIGAITAFFLALLGDLIASWVDTRARRNRFVVLRALGATSRQISAMLLWEQGIIYLGALALGLGLGALLTRAAVPVLVLTDLPAHGPMSLMSINDLYFLQQALPARLVVPSSLPLIFVALVLVCFIVLGTMIRAVLHSKISSELRLNED